MAPKTAKHNHKETDLLIAPYESINDWLYVGGKINNHNISICKSAECYSTILTLDQPGQTVQQSNNAVSFTSRKVKQKVWLLHKSSASKVSKHSDGDGDDAPTDSLLKQDRFSYFLSHHKPIKASQNWICSCKYTLQKYTYNRVLSIKSSCSC